MELCSACARRITFGKTALKCLSCRLIVHSGCRQQLIQTCIPPSATKMLRTPATLSPISQVRSMVSTEQVVSSPTFLSRTFMRNFNLASLCPPDQFPRIPAVVIHCINELMARGMKTIGIYRVSGSEKQVKELFEKFMRCRGTPSLALVDDVHVICGCLKLFLRSLDEPLVTFIQRPNLITASEKYFTNLDTAVREAVDVLQNLPIPNRDTLSYIMLHLKAVSISPECQMGEENLATVFGPTLVGYSCPEPQLSQTVDETKAQKTVVRLLFAIPEHVYSSFIDPNGTYEPCLVHQDSTYFSPLTTNAFENGIKSTPNLRRKLHVTNSTSALGLSANKKFFPNLLSTNRDTTSISEHN